MVQGLHGISINLRALGIVTITSSAQMAPLSKAEAARQSRQWEALTPALSEWILDAISSMGFTKTTPVQQAAIPMFMGNKDVVVGELAGWTTWREKVGRDAIRAFVKDTLVRERERGKRMERCLRSVRELRP